MRQNIDISDKPYNKCMSCHHFRKKCGGYPTRDMSLKEWCEYLRAVKDHFHLSNAAIATEAQVSQTTTDRVLAGTLEQDMMRGTCRRLEIVILGPVGYTGCLLEREVLGDQLQTMVNKYNDAQKKIDFLVDENARKAKVIDKLLEAK